MHMTKIRLVLTIAAIASMAVAVSAPARADVQLHTFQAGERARAADVNGNFNNLKIAVEAAERRNAELTGRIRDLEAAIANLRGLNGVLSIETINGAKTVRLSGVNLQVVNGLNRTESINGTGNVIIGYDEPNTFTTKPICSRATATNGALLATEAACLASGGVFSTQHKSGSHNLVLGTANGYSSAGGMVGGRFNYINEVFATVVAGVDNRASGRFSAIVAGQGHSTLESAAILGGIGNQATARNSVIVGGVGNLASGENSTIGGGERNIASGRTATVASGLLNTASGERATVAGGRNNVASGEQSAVFGGERRSATATNQSVP